MNIPPFQRPGKIPGFFIILSNRKEKFSFLRYSIIGENLYIKGVPRMEKWEQWIINFIEEYGYLGIFLLKALENVFPPVPAEVVLTFGGFMTSYSDLTTTGIIIFSTLGSVTGASILYGIGLLIKPQKIENLIDKWGYLFRLKKEDFHKATAWFTKYGVWAIFFCRFIPVIRSLISIPAGMFRINFGIFLLLTGLGTFIWNITLVHVGSLVGDSWEKILKFLTVNIGAIIFLLILICMIVLWVIIQIQKRRSKQK